MQGLAKGAQKVSCDRGNDRTEWADYRRHGGFGPLSMARLKTLQVVAVPYVRTYTYVPRQFHLHFAFVMS